MESLLKSTPADSELHPAYDWERIAYLALVSRTMDEMEEREGFVKYQFSARGHELSQLLLSQQLTHNFDGVSAYYRSRPMTLGLGMTIEEGFAAGLARAGSATEGRDVGVVYNRPNRNGPTILPMVGDVGGQYTPSVGWAQAIQYRVDELGERDKEGSISVVHGGDGSTASNGFWSALNIATTLKLPLLFFIEDNGYAISVKSPLQNPGANIADNLAAYGNLRIWQGDGCDPVDSAEIIQTAVNYVRTGDGPALVRLTVPRLSGHSSVDNQNYKSEEETAAEWARDPINKLKAYLVPTLFSADEWETLVDQAERDVEQARDEAMARPEPDVRGVTDYTWHDPADPAEMGGMAAEGIHFPATSEIPNPPNPRRINMIDAIRKTIDHELAINDRAVVFGEDVGFKGGVHAATLGLQKKHGEARVFDTSLSEEGIIGRSVGMAIAGLMPIPEIQFRKYADPATEQINNTGTIRWRSANRFAAPMVVRIPGGYRKIGDPWHSVTSEVTFAHQPGWKFAAPSNAEDATGLLRTALRCNDPVIFFEHRAMLDAAWARRPYPGDDFAIPFGKAKFTQRGDLLTIVTWGAMVERCEKAAQNLGAEVDIIDLRTIIPWDKETVIDSIRKTSKCLIVHEDIGVGGFGAEIAAVIAKDAFMDLDAPILRVTSPSTLVPYSQTLMAGVVPSVERIQAAIEEQITF